MKNRFNVIKNVLNIFEVRTVVKISMLVFWVYSRVDLQVYINVSEEYTASIFRH
jgi:hypothetical protein